MTPIKNILVPIDFSATARVAFEYAKVLAQALDAQITVLHVNQYFLAASDITQLITDQNNEDRLKEAMEAFVNEDNEALGETVMVKTATKTKILRGEAVGCIVDLSLTKTVDLIVMGTTGLQDFLSKIIGSVSLEVSNKAHCPVLLVPRDAHWTPIDRILFASNAESTTPSMVRQVSNFAQCFNASVHFVHVNHTEENNTPLISTIWDELYEKSNAAFPFEIHTVYGSDTIEQLQKYVAKNDISLMVFVSKHRTFWQNLIHNSVTEKMSLSSEVPMLILHDADKKGQRKRRYERS